MKIHRRSDKRLYTAGRTAQVHLLNASSRVATLAARLCAVLFVASLVSAATGGNISAGRVREARGASRTRPVSKLAVLTDAGWRTWWTSRNAPARWRAPLPVVAGAVRWRPSRNDGVEWGELRIAGSGEAWRLRVILARIDPTRVRLQLYRAIRSDSLAGAWTVDSAPDDAVLAVDAGQFSYGRPWGWVVRRGDEEQPPGRGPLSSAIVIDSSGSVSLVAASDLPLFATRVHPAEAFQSYPTLLVGDGDIPAPVRGAPADSASAIDVAHRDSRLAIGQLRDGKLIIALTRFDGLAGVFAFVPFGPTVPETAAIMGALGCRTAVMLDGGISGQMMLRDRDNTAHTWPGWRKVPLGLVVLPRAVGH